MQRKGVTVLAQLRLRAECIPEGTRDLLKFARAVRRTEKDCLAIEIVQDLDDPAQITMIEKWSSREAYSGPHLQTAHMKAFVEQSGRYFDGPARISIGEGTDIGGENWQRDAPYAR